MTRSIPRRILSSLISVGLVTMAAQAQTVYVQGPASGIAPQGFTTPRATISDAGLSLGTVLTSGTRQAVVWGPTSGPATTLPTLGFTNTFGTAIGDSGVAVGYGQTGSTTSTAKALRWDSNGVGTVLETLTPRTSDGFVDARAVAVNAAGTAVGYSSTFAPGTETLLGTRATVWSAGSSTVTALSLTGPALPTGLAATNSSGFGTAQARAITASGLIVGDGILYQGNVAQGSRGFVWNSDGTLALTLAPVSADASGFSFVEVKGVNETGTVFGNSRLYAGSIDLGLRAVRWEAGSSAATQLGTLGTLPDGKNIDTTAIGIDAAGNIAGLSQKYVDGVAKGTRAVVWKAGETTPLELEILGTDANGSTRGNMSAMNSFGFIAGTQQSYDEFHFNLGRRAVVWDIEGNIYNLNELLMLPLPNFVLTVATDITDTGWVSGYGTFDPDPANGSTSDTEERYFSMHVPAFAVPEPASALLLSLGAATLALTRRRKADRS